MHQILASFFFFFPLRDITIHIYDRCYTNWARRFMMMIMVKVDCSNKEKSVGKRKREILRNFIPYLNNCWGFSMKLQAFNLCILCIYIYVGGFHIGGHAWGDNIFLPQIFFFFFEYFFGCRISNALIGDDDWRFEWFLTLHLIGLFRVLFTSLLLIVGHWIHIMFVIMLQLPCWVIVCFQWLTFSYFEIFFPFCVTRIREINWGLVRMKFLIRLWSTWMEKHKQCD